MREGGVGSTRPMDGSGKHGLNDAEHIHVGSDRLIRRFSVALVGEVASPGESRGVYAPRLGIIATGSRDGWEHPVADDGVLSSP